MTGQPQDRDERTGAELSERIERSADRIIAASEQLPAAGVEGAAAQIQRWAVQRFTSYGPTDARGAAFWDVAAWLRETYIPSLAAPVSAGEPKENA